MVLRLSASVSSKCPFPVNWLRVFRSAHTAHLGRGVGQERWWRVGPSEKYAARCGSMWDEMHMRTACFARAPQRCTSRLSKHFLLTFQEVTLLSKTRNQLIVNGRLALGIVWNGQALPLHPRIKHPQNEIEDAVIAQFALRSPLGHRKVR
jgi:hypothetical protein